jgi:hypothetical protein
MRRVHPSGRAIAGATGLRMLCNGAELAPAAAASVTEQPRAMTGRRYGCFGPSTGGSDLT